ncbi:MULTISPECIES: hypothetical protein [Flavobacterium]|jgi:hypothetical protein|uniref:Lipoprotein n=1 Tax=Flavobacterium jumunjinense TaxID=998845 RepID=A0ABV5GL10_9FLAO|nr:MULTISPECIES: hypothetical protein [Flavobacterium]
MKKNILIILVLISTISCGIKTYKLKNGYSKVAIDQKVYQNKKYFEKSILKKVDTLAVYEEYNTTYYSGDKPVNALARENYENVNTIYGVYKFYGNGNFNLFMLNREKPLLESKMFDPEYTGWRGILYSENNVIKGDLITQITGMGEIGIIKQTFEFYGDTLIVNKKGNKFGNEIYIKRKIPIELLKNNAKW